MEQRTELTEIIDYINPSALNYQEWINIGMALKYEGYSERDWDDWSRRDSARYHDGECERKWNTFRGTNSPVTGGTIVQMALDNGWVPAHGHELDWDDDIQADDHTIIDKDWIEDREVQEPKQWDPCREIIT